jgi:hypothetical protein
MSDKQYCDYYKTFLCDHSWMKAFLFHDDDAFLFDRNLFKLYEDAIRHGYGHPTRLCKGTYVSGTACDNCWRCKDEMNRTTDRFELRKIYNKMRNI